MPVPKFTRCNQIALGSSYSGINSLVSELATHLQTIEIIHWDLFINLMGDIWLTPCLTFVVDVQLLTCVWIFVTPRIAALQTSLSFIISWSLLKLMSTYELMMPSNHLILCYLPNSCFSCANFLCYFKCYLLFLNCFCTLFHFLCKIFCFGLKAFLTNQNSNVLLYQLTYFLVLLSIFQFCLHHVSSWKH